MKTKLKFIIFTAIAAAIIVIGMTVGTICHFVSNGFFNYGDEFSSYKSIVVRYSSAEYTEDEAKALCEENLKDLGAYSVSVSEVSLGGEIVYKFSAGKDDAALTAAVEKLNEDLNVNGSGLNVASVHEGTVKEGGARALEMAAIALSAAVFAQFIYFIFRFKLRAALTALCVNLVNVGLFVSFVAALRLPVGAELIALALLVAFVGMICFGVFADRVRKNFKNEKYEKSARDEVINVSANESQKTIYILTAALAIASLIPCIFAVIASASAISLAALPLFVIGMLACMFGVNLFAPALYCEVDALCEKVKLSRAKKAEKNAKPQKAQS